MTNAHGDVSAVTAIRHALEAAENSRDADALAALLTDDAVLMVPDFPAQEGRAACLRFVRGIMSRLLTEFVRRVTYVSAEVVVTGDTAFDRGTFSFDVSPKGGGEVTRVTGKYFWLLRRTDRERWRIARLIVSRDEESEVQTDNGDEPDSSTPSEPLGTEHASRGTVKWWRDEKGYGVIAAAATAPWDIWCHFSAIDTDGYRSLQRGEEVEVEYMRFDQDTFKYIARRVRSVGPA
jgi:cold shock protein